MARLASFSFGATAKESYERMIALDARVILHDRSVPDAALPKPAIRPYPLAYVGRWTSPQGAAFVIRPIRPEDESLIVAFHRTLSAETVYQRYFANLGGATKPAGKAFELIKEWWGGYDAWQAEFKRTANGLSGGSGWVVLALNLHTGEAHNYWASDHTTQAVLGAPLLVLDMYEHAYHVDYGAAAARYVDAFMDNVNWEEVARRAEWAAKAVRA